MQYLEKYSYVILVQFPPLNWITLGLHKSDNNNQMIQSTEVLRVLFRYKVTSNIWLQLAADYIIRDPIKQQALYLVVA